MHMKTYQNKILVLQAKRHVSFMNLVRFKEGKVNGQQMNCGDCNYQRPMKSHGDAHRHDLLSQEPKRLN